ncbi:hypothetical protein MRX96_058880 [Rhipicephalus microplus]
MASVLHNHNSQGWTCKTSSLNPYLERSTLSGTLKVKTLENIEMLACGFSHQATCKSWCFQLKTPQRPW